MDAAWPASSGEAIHTSTFLGHPVGCAMALAQIREIETRNLDEVKEVLESGGIDRIMLDNFEPEALKQAVQLINKIFETEASGGINLQNVRAYAETGVDFISVGALTHSFDSIDISMKITPALI